MSKPAAIAGSLVDVRNVGTHKSMRLTIHVPEEYALKVIEAFGWPTGAAPISVAIARMVEQGERREREPKSFRDLPPSQQAGICCNDPIFRAFLREAAIGAAGDQDIAAETVRNFCGVESRGDIKTGTVAGRRWADLHSKFQSWKIADQVSA